LEDEANKPLYDRMQRFPLLDSPYEARGLWRHSYPRFVPREHFLQWLEYAEIIEAREVSPGVVKDMFVSSSIDDIKSYMELEAREIIAWSTTPTSPETKVWGRPYGSHIPYGGKSTNFP